MLENDPMNFQPLNGSMNCSKGCTVNGTDNPWPTYKGQPLDADYSKWLGEQQADMQFQFQTKINTIILGR